MSDLNLLPCPFCGNDAVHVHDSYCAGSGFMVLCGNCTAEGPLCNTESDAASGWNNRAAPIAAQLDQDAERAAFESAVKAKGWPLHRYPQDSATPYSAPSVEDHWQGWLMARRAAPAAAQLDAELPPLPRSIADMRTGGLTVEPGYTAEQYRQGQRDAIAPHAERIRLLDHEAITQKLANQVLRDRVAFLESERNLMEANLRACIDGRTAGTAPKAPDPTEEAIERRAKEIYAGFVFADRHPWVDGGNSIRQDDARYQARAEFAAAPSPQENTNG